MGNCSRILAQQESQLPPLPVTAPVATVGVIGVLRTKFDDCTPSPMLGARPVLSESRRMHLTEKCIRGRHCTACDRWHTRDATSNGTDHPAGTVLENVGGETHYRGSSGRSENKSN